MAAYAQTAIHRAIASIVHKDIADMSDYGQFSLNLTLQLCVLCLCSLFYHSLSELCRRYLLLALASAGLLPAVHWLFLASSHEVFSFGFGVASLLLLYGLAFVIFDWEFPERFYPCLFFDYCLHSHQIWHVLLVFGGLLWIRSLHSYTLFREQTHALNPLTYCQTKEGDMTFALYIYHHYISPFLF